MQPPAESITLTPEQVVELNKRLSEMRHNVNNNLSLIVAAVEIIKRKPESAERMLGMLNEQPNKIVGEIQRFSGEFERIMRVH